LRFAFSQVKIDRDNLAIQMQESEAKEKEWRSTLEKFSSEMARLESSIASKEIEATNTVKTLEQKNSALIADLRFMRSENEKVQEKYKEAQQQILQVDSDLASQN